MSFWPFPKTLLEQLRAGASLGPAVDLGSGRGEFARQLRRIDVPAWVVDRQFDALEGETQGIRADVRRLPFADSSLGLLTSANFVRHLCADDIDSLLAETARCAAAAARQVFVEDLPEARDGAESNYRRTLELLARVDPTRGVACAPERIEAHLVGSGWRRTHGERFDNELRPVDPMLPLRWLRSRARTPSLLDEVRRLEQDVHKMGLAYGQAWYLVLEREDA